MPWSRLAGAFQLLQLGQDQAGVRDGVDPNVVATAVCRSSPEDHIHPDESAVRRADCEPGRLGDDRCFGTNSCREELAHTEALVLFVREA